MDKNERETNDPILPNKELRTTADRHQLLLRLIEVQRERVANAVGAGKTTGAVLDKTLSVEIKRLSSMIALSFEIPGEQPREAKPPKDGVVSQIIAEVLGPSRKRTPKAPSKSQNS